MEWTTDDMRSFKRRYRGLLVGMLSQEARGELKSVIRLD